MEWSGVVATFTVCCLVAVVAVGGGAVAIESTPQDTTAPIDDASVPAVVDETTPGHLLEEIPERNVGAAAGHTAIPLLGDVGEQEFDRTEFRISVTSEGDAQWTFRFRRLIESDEEREQFDAFAEEFRTEETEFYLSFREQAVDLADTGAAATDRDMQATGFERSAQREDQFGNEFGVVEIRFTWTNFAVRDDDGTVRMGDVFEGPLFIGENQRLVLEAGDGLRFEEVEPDAVFSGETLEESTSVTWEGQREFVDGHPRAVFVPEEGATPVDGGSPIGFSPGQAAFGLLVVAMIVAGVFTLYQRGVFDADETTEDSASTETPTSTAESEPAISDEELLSDEDRVVQLIEDHGGRMKQVDIVEETGWSKSKVSMLLSDMEADGTLSKIRVGRENIVALEGHEPEAVGSPFDDEG